MQPHAVTPHKNSWTFEHSNLILTPELPRMGSFPNALLLMAAVRDLPAEQAYLN